MIIKHLIPIVRRSAALFMCLGFTMLHKHDRNFYIFCTNVTKFMVENKNVFSGTDCFHRVYLSQVFVLFSILFVIFKCQHCSVHKKFCKEEKLVVWFLL